MLRTEKLPTEIFHKETHLVSIGNKIVEKVEYHFTGVEKEIIKGLKIFAYDKKGNPIYSFDF